MKPTDLLGVVLAGGASRRFGRDKAALPWAGTTLTRRAASLLAAVCGETVIAGPAELAPSGVEAVADLFPDRGPVGGLHAGLERAGGRPIFALACDLPLVEEELVRHLIASAAAAVAGGAWVAVDGPRVQPLCGVYAASTRSVAAARLAAGKQSALGFFEAVGGVAVAIPAGLASRRPDQLLNLNRPDDLRRARRLHAAGAGR